MRFTGRVFALAATFSALIGVSPAMALVNRAFVSATGTNGASCGTVTAPCKTLQYVHDSIVNPGGEIVITGPGEYGPITITKALTIVNQGGGTASLSQPLSSQNAVWIRAGANDSVFLRGLTLEGAWAASTGIYYRSGGSLQVSDCVIRRFKSLGVFAAPTGSSKVLMTNTIISDNGSGVLLAPVASFAGAIRSVRFINNANGFEVSGRNAPAGTPIYVVMSESVGTGNSNAFMSTSISGKAIPTFALDRDTASGNGIGVLANRGNVRLSNTIVAGNGTGVSISSGVVFSNKTNSIVDNGARVLGGAITAVAAD